MTPLLNLVNTYPPILCRMIAHESNRRPTSIKQLAERTGQSPRTIIRLSQRKTWNGVSVQLASAFMAACGVDPLHPKATNAYIRRTAKSGTAFQHLNDRTRKHLAAALQ